jgi:mannose-6-phosphate isomerase
MTVLPLHCTVQHYAWGSKTSIPKLLGVDTPQNEPWAEFWMGAHPKAPSKLHDGTSIVDFIAANPTAALGREGTLPFLFKILAAEGPLSIQCHPNKTQAEAGYAREEALGIPKDAPNRNYRDANHKPELIVALEEFWALKGFRSPDAIAQLFQRAQMHSASPLLEALAGAGGLRAFYTGLLGLDSQATTQLLTELARGLGNLPKPEARWSQGLLARYPHDQGATSALVLQLVQLEAGQALYLGAGELHAYLRGTGLEIMANSDNVLRGGLTPKHVDPAELQSVLRFEHEPIHILNAEGTTSLRDYKTSCPDFALSRMTLERSSSSELVPTSPSAQIWLNLGDETELQWGTETTHLARGGVLFVTANSPSIEVIGRDTRAVDLWIASYPAA